MAKKFYFFLKYWPVLVIIGLWFLFSSPYFFKGLVPFPSRYLVTFFAPWNASFAMPVKNNAMPDVISQIYPWKMLTIETWKNGQIPLWNPYSFSGTAHAANYQSAVFSPFNILFFLLPFIHAWSMTVLLQPVLAGLFMFMFLKSLGCRNSSSLIGSIGFMFSGFLVCWMAYGTIGYALLFLPLILVGIKKTYASKSLFGYMLIPLGIALSFLSGHFQISFYVLGLSVAYALYEGIQTKAKKKIVLVLILVVLGLFVAAPQLLLTLEAFAKSTRGLEREIREVIPWNYLITFFSPDFYGNPVTRNDWFGHYAEWTGFVGVVPFILAIFAACFSSKKEKLFFICVFVVSILLSYAGPVSSLLYVLKIPVLSTSAASRIISLAGFSLAVLAAFGMDEVWERLKSQKIKSFVLFGVSTVLLFSFIWIILIIGKTLPVEKVLVAKRNFVLPSLLAFAVVVSVCITTLKNIPKALTRVILIFIIAIAIFDGYRFSSKWMPFDEQEYVYPQSKVLTFLRSTIGINRVFGGIGGEVGTTYAIPLIEGYDALYQGRYGEYINASSNGIISPAGRSVVPFDKHGLFAKETLQILGVRYILHRISDGRNIWAFPFWEYPAEDMKSIYRDEHYEVFENVKAYPRAFLASSFLVAANPTDEIDLLFDKNVDRRETIILEKEPQVKPSSGEGQAEILIYSPMHIRIRTDSSIPKLLFLSDTYDPGWKASVDGKTAEVLRADYDFRAVALPSGTHIVEFRYQPVLFRVGIFIAAAAIILLLVIPATIKRTV